MSKRSIAAKDNKSPFRMLAGISSVLDLVDGQVSMAMAAMGAKNVYYVDSSNGNDGKLGTGGWDNALKTLTVALATSQADVLSQAEGDYARNVIFCKGGFDEDLVLLAKFTDVIGVGSYSGSHKCGLIGNHVPTGAATAGHNTRFINFFFQGNAAGGDLWTLDSLVSGLEFHGCTFDAASATAATAAIVNTASPFMGLFGNDFRGLYTDATIEFGAGVGFRGTKIVGNYIEGANNGIELAAGTTPGAAAALLDGLIKDNVIKVTGLTIDDNADIAIIIGNTLITAAVTIAAAIDINLPTAAHNYLTNPTVNMIYPTEDATT